MVAGEHDRALVVLQVLRDQMESVR
jgi:hypothetical protein